MYVLIQHIPVQKLYVLRRTSKHIRKTQKGRDRVESTPTFLCIIWVENEFDCTYSITRKAASHGTTSSHVKGWFF